MSGSFILDVFIIAAWYGSSLFRTGSWTLDAFLVGSVILFTVPFCSLMRDIFKFDKSNDKDK